MMKARPLKNKPTAEELRYGHECITSSGPASEIVHELSLLAALSPYLRDVLTRLKAGEKMLRKEGIQSAAAIEEGTVAGALIYGLHLGLCIGEARAAKDSGAPVH